jgi:hypothetical protein
MKRWIVSLAVGLLTLASAAAAQDVARVWVSSAGIDFEPLVDQAGLVLTVSGPDGFHHRAAFEPGEAPAFSLFDGAAGVLPDGSYTWELRAVPTDLRRRDAEPGDEVATKGARGSERLVQSGAFSIVGGAVVSDGKVEPGQNPAHPGPVLSFKTDVLTNADGTIRSSLCVGTDCTNAEAFGFDTLRLKENNTRIKFQDTSVGSFPTNDWEIEANSTLNGGPSYLRIDDVDHGTSPFTIEAGAPSHSLYVDDLARIGVGTSTPVLEIHAVDGDTPGLRLEQDASNGFTPQTWDVAGNEVNFFVRDVTHGARLPFRIQADAPSNTLYLAASGNVGLGTNTPAARLDVVGDIAVSGTVDGRDVSADGATLDAHVTDFDNPHQVTAEQLGIEEDETKAGVVAAAAFSGNPSTVTVSFATPFPAGTSYALLLTAVTDDDKKTASPTVLAKSEAGFTVTLGNGGSSHVVEVDWLARPVGE